MIISPSKYEIPRKRVGLRLILHLSGSGPTIWVVPTLMTGKQDRIRVSTTRAMGAGTKNRRS